MEYINKRFKTSIIISLIGIVCVYVTGCKKLVDVDPPKDKILTSAVFIDNSTATAAQFGVFYGLEQQISMTLSKGTALSSDELKNYSTNPAVVSLYTNSLSSATNLDGGTYSKWSFIYNYLYQENAIIEAIPKSTITADLKKQLEGEAKFTRAMLHFYLTNLFGDIPIVTSTDYTINARLSRSPMEKVYEQIIADLKDAQNLLSKDFIDANLLPSTERVRPTKSAASALLARVYLYKGDYINAELLATTVINDTNFSLLDDLNNVFIKNSKEAIWQLIPGISYLNTFQGNDFILLGPPSGSAAIGNATISPQLWSAFENGDQRKVKWIGTVASTASPSVSYNYPYKYKVQTGNALIEYDMVLRLAEQYLIRAEARAQLGKEDAVNDLNTIRHRAGLGDYKGSTDKASLVAAIIHERQVELFTEWGNRWLDLKRTKTVDAIMNTVTPAKGGGSWKSSQQLYPIPESDRKNNPNLSQNPGY